MLYKKQSSAELYWCYNYKTDTLHILDVYLLSLLRNFFNVDIISKIWKCQTKITKNKITYFEIGLKKLYTMC